MNEQQEQDWRSDLSEPTETLKITDGEEVVFVFQDEGVRKTHPDFGTSVVFTVLKEGEAEQSWYVKANNFSLLGQIKEIGNLTGVKAKVSRKGAGRSDTRYKIEKI